MTDGLEPVDMQEAREKRGAAVVAEKGEEQAAIDSAELMGAMERANEPGSPELDPPKRVGPGPQGGLNLDEVFAMYGLAEFQKAQFQRQAQQLSQENFGLKQELMQANNLIATKDATIRNLARKTVEDKKK